MQIHELNTFPGTPGETDFLPIDSGFDTAKISAAKLLRDLLRKPIEEGAAGQILRNDGNGGSEWSDVGLPTDEQTEEAINKWLDDHPEATTTVADGSLTEAKFSDALKVKAVKKYITPDMFAGATDAAKLQAAIDYSIANGLPSIGLERVYDLTGDTIAINKGVRVTDDVSAYSRNKLDFIGFGEAKLRKTDAGFMFSASLLSGDITFTNVKFQGYSPSDLPVDCVDMKVFDCAKLIRLTLINCTFTWCNRVYYQYDLPANTAQSIVSIGNLYAKNNIVADLLNLFDGRFIGDTIEDGVQFFKSWDPDYPNPSAVRSLKIAECCIEGMSDKAIQIWISYGVSITDNYFEANRGHISIPRLFTGSITGNMFLGRGNLPLSEEISCIEICLGLAYDIVGNYCIETNEHTTFIKINTASPYYNTKQKIFGGNYAESPTVLTNVPDDVIGAIEISRNLSTYAKTDTQDLTANIKSTYSQITGGTIIYTKMNGFNIMDIGNLVIASPIVSGSHTADAALLTPTDGGSHNAVLGDNSTGKCGTMFLNSMGSFGLRIPNAGTYSGQIVWR